MAKRSLFAALAAFAGTLAMAGTAMASVPSSARTILVHRPDSGNGTTDGGNWAYDNILRDFTLSAPRSTTATDCGAATCYAYTATLRDAGTFRTIPGAETPNQDNGGLLIKGQVSGKLKGKAQFSFDASSNSPDLSLIPRFLYGDIDSTSTWYELAFPAGTTFGGAGIGTWGWAYAAKCVTISRYWHHHRWYLRYHVTTEHWVDASWNGSGDEPGDGNITGCLTAHPGGLVTS